MPDEFQQFSLKWARYHPSWKIKLWTDETIPNLSNQEAYNGAQSFAAKADILRYELLLRYGGVYVDTDFECLRPIDKLLDGIDCFVGQQRDLDTDFGKFCYVNNALIGAIPGHPLLRDLVELLGLHLDGLPDDMPAAYLTGPHYLTSVLQAHPEVKIFPAKYFYPYTATERWRRYEEFPDSYAVHHWTLSDLTVNRTKPRQIGVGDTLCLTVVIMFTKYSDVHRLRWVLEGLCLQSVSNFEILFQNTDTTPEISSLCSDYRSRLRLRFVSCPPDMLGNMSTIVLRNSALHAAQSSRVLFLNSDCLPDPDVVETHARYGNKSVLLYAWRRIYPVEKYFMYRDAVDYSGLLQHCYPERTGMYVAPTDEGWRDVMEYCFSVPKAIALSHGGFDSADIEGDVIGVARRLSGNKCPSIPCIYGARVTHMGPNSNAIVTRHHATAQYIVLNHSIAHLKKRGVASGQGINGKSPYVIKMASLNGTRQESISALAFNLLSEFSEASIPAEAVARVSNRVAIEPVKIHRVALLCATYVNQFLSSGVLVPSSATQDLNKTEAKRPSAIFNSKRQPYLGTAGDLVIS